LFQVVEADHGGLTATTGWSDCQPLFQGCLTTTRGGLTTSSSNGKKKLNFVAVTFLAV
jgi:hypothetical protein